MKLWLAEGTFYLYRSRVNGAFTNGLIWPSVVEIDLLFAWIL